MPLRSSSPRSASGLRLEPTREAKTTGLHPARVVYVYRSVQACGYHHSLTFSQVSLKTVTDGDDD